MARRQRNGDAGAAVGIIRRVEAGSARQGLRPGAPGQYVIAGAASMTAALVAAWLPARKAASVDPVDILRGAT